MNFRLPIGSILYHNANKKQGFKLIKREDSLFWIDTITNAIYHSAAPLSLDYYMKSSNYVVELPINYDLKLFSILYE